MPLRPYVHKERAGRAAYTKSERRRSANLKQLYGITLADFELLVEAQGGGCAVCGAVDQLVVDHHHLSGRVRGVLCGFCNRALGYIREDPEFAAALLLYASTH